MPYKSREVDLEYLRKYYQEHKDIIREKHRKYRQRPEVKVRMKTWRREHRLSLERGAINIIKRIYSETCEVCRMKQEKQKYYHHWDNEHPEQGIWVCGECHKMAEGIDKNLHVKYLELKDSIISLSKSGLIQR